jgi:hypothetical protein
MKENFLNTDLFSITFRLCCVTAQMIFSGSLLEPMSKARMIEFILRSVSASKN